MADTTMFTKYAEQNMMQGMRNWLAAGVVTQHLVKADFTLDIDAAILGLVDADEADFDGYAAKTLNFGAVSLDANKKAQIQASGVTYTMNGSTGNTIYGWYIINTLTGHEYLVEAKKYSQSAPDNRKDMTASGNTLTISTTLKAFDTSIAP